MKKIRAGIEISSERIRLFVMGEGWVLDEKCLAALDDRKAILAWGQQAEELYEGLEGKEGAIRIVSPFRNGKTDTALLGSLIEQILYENRVLRMFSRCELAVSCPALMTEADRLALSGWLMDAGADEVWCEDRILFAAIGSRLDIYSPVACTILYIGRENSELAVFEKGGLEASTQLKLGARKAEKAVEAWLKRQGLIVSEAAARQIMEQLGTVQMVRSPLALEIRGLDPDSYGLRTAIVDENQIASVLVPFLRSWAAWIEDSLQNLSGPLQQDIASRGIVLCGEGGRIRELAYGLQRASGLPVYLADDPAGTVRAGIELMLERMK